MSVFHGAACYPHSMKRVCSTLGTALLLALFAALLLVAGQPAAQAQARALPDFTDLVAKADPAVVNIRTTARAVARGPYGGGGGQDPYELDHPHPY